MTDNNEIKPRTWNAFAVGALLIALALGLILYWVTKDLITAFGIILLIYGAYMALTSTKKAGGEDNFGPSEADAALAGGSILAGIGITCLIWAFTHEVVITAAVLIIIVAVVGMALAYKNRGI